MPTGSITTKSYTKLLSTVKAEIKEGRESIARQQAATYWKVGKHISKFILLGKDRADYGKQTYRRLSKDLKVDERTLQQSVKFSREFPIPSARSELSWTQYRSLITIDNPKKRKKLQQRAVQKKLSSRALAQEIKNNKLTTETLPLATSNKLTSLKGRINLFQITQLKCIHSGDTTLLLDCGFKHYKDIDLTGITNPKNGDIVERAKKVFKRASAKAGELYTYVAYVERVIDGDTILAQIDVGFGDWTRQKLRLRGIDTPELGTVKGEQAKAFVERQLKPCDSIIIKTYKEDKYDRYVADIWYKDTSNKTQDTKDVFLNQVLLDQKLAVRV